MSSDLHHKVIFVGDRPSKHNIRKDVPFVGTKSYKTLLEWIYEMDLDIRNIGLINATDLQNRLFWETRHIVYRNYRVIALGKKASSFLRKAGVEFFEMPHPSGLNRILNNKKDLEKRLLECKMYINAGVSL